MLNEMTVGDRELQHHLGLDLRPPASCSDSWVADEGGRNKAAPKLQKKGQSLSISSSNFSKRVRLQAALEQCFSLLSLHACPRMCQTAPSNEMVGISWIWIPAAHSHLLSKMLGLRDSCAEKGIGSIRPSLEVVVCTGTPRRSMAASC